MDAVYKHIKILFYLILLFSGMLKWGPLQSIDSTIIFGVLCIGIMVLELIVDTSLLVKVWRMPSLAVIMLVILSAISLIYTSSESYCFKKMLQFILTVAAFFYPQIVLGSSDYPLLLNYLKGFLAVAVITLFFFFVNFGYTFLPLIILATDSKTSIPNYLVLSGFLVMALLYLMNKNKVSDLFLKVMAAFLLFQLGGRGPIIIMVIIMLFDYLLLNFRIKRIALIAVAIFVTIASIIYFDVDVSNNRSLNRFQSLNSGKDRSLNERLRLINASFSIIENNVVLGTGLGSYGQEVKGRDFKAYPHNLFLEVASELGLLGIIFCLLFIVSVFVVSLQFFYRRKVLFVRYKGAIYVALFLFLENLKSNSFFENKLLFGAIGILLLLSQSPSEEPSNTIHEK